MGISHEPAGDALTGEALPPMQVVVRHERMAPWASLEEGNDSLEGVREVRHDLSPFRGPRVVPAPIVGSARLLGGAANCSPPGCPRHEQIPLGWRSIFTHAPFRGSAARLGDQAC